MRNHPPAVVPCREQDAAMTTLVLDVLEGADEVRDASEAEAETDDGGPGAVEKHQ